MSCQICTLNNTAKYKCPTCRIPYCSLTCWKQHKTAECHPVEQVGAPSVTSNPYNFPTEDTVPFEKLKLLEHNQELKNLLCNRHLRDLLVALDKSVDPAAAMQQAMLEPIFVEFADECLKVVEESH